MEYRGAMDRVQSLDGDRQMRWIVGTCAIQENSSRANMKRVCLAAEGAVNGPPCPTRQVWRGVF